MMYAKVKDLRIRIGPKQIRIQISIDPQIFNRLDESDETARGQY